MPVPLTLLNSLTFNLAKIEITQQSLVTQQPALSVLQGLVAKDYESPYADVPQNLQREVDAAVRNVGQAIESLQSAAANLQSVIDGYIVPNGAA
jgi:hypothetical protein